MPLLFIILLIVAYRAGYVAGMRMQYEHDLKTMRHIVATKKDSPGIFRVYIKQTKK